MLAPTHSRYTPPAPSRGLVSRQGEPSVHAEMLCTVRGTGGGQHTANRGFSEGPRGQLLSPTQLAPWAATPGPSGERTGGALSGDSTGLKEQL